ncbi:MAG: hypothetical protein KUF75_17770 [Candidatus Thiodiazotropha sp. (ex Ctena orbiculata)]|nr:hypothetical protein [Candidatus Thiodiazotropha sp. (ex Codakia orbicularis)]MBV2126998.1 hypothetical protein [Candidatus Thiodiazotropha taylori]
MVLSLTLLVFGFLLTGLAVRQFVFKRKLIAASLSGLLGLLVLLVATFVSMLLFNVQSYIQLTKERVLAEVEIVTVDAGTASLRLTVDGKRKIYALSAHEWRLDARFIKWKPWVALLGKDPVVRLDALSGRNIVPGNSVIKVYNLHEDYEVIDSIIANLTDHFGMVDTMYGSSVYMPIEAGAHYQVSANHAGLIARPVNRKGEQAVVQWDM